MDISKYKRIMIIGNNGSGKSYFSRELATIINIPLTHLDNEYWKPNWSITPKKEWVKKQNQIISNNQWIIEGNYTDTMEIRFSAADIVIFLDVNRLLCLISVIMRCGKKRPDMPHYIVEKYDKGFLKLCKGLWDFDKERKKIIMELRRRYSDKEFLHIKGRKMANMLLNQWNGK